MPIYEEKLISPLAIRFTQQRIRRTFRDSREVEATIKQVTARPGIGDYDLILSAPFPTIEIIRWSPNGRGAGEKDHWFTFDNRRLYCLQRLAVQYWPKRVGATVEVLYADAGAIRKKLDSRTCGLSVEIGHAFATAGELEQWSWRKAVDIKASETLAVETEAAVLADDIKATVSDLADAPSGPCLLEQEDLQAQADISGMSRAEESTVTEDSENQGYAKCAAPVPSLEDGTLTNLIGQLLDLKTKECVQSQEHATDAVSSTRSPSFSAHTEPTDSESGAVKLPTSLPTVAASSEAEVVCVADEAKVQQHSAQKDCGTPALKQKRTGKKVAKETRFPNAAQQAQAMWAFQASQFQMAQCQMAQWEMMQWHTAQMAQWEHAAQAMQFEAAQWEQAEMSWAQ